MTGKINSTTFKGIIRVNAGDKNRISGDKAHIFNIEPRALDTSKISGIVQREKDGFTMIGYKSIPNNEYSITFYYIPTNITSTSDILAAYSAAKDSNLNVTLEDKSAR